MSLWAPRGRYGHKRRTWGRLTTQKAQPPHPEGESHWDVYLAEWQRGHRPSRYAESMSRLDRITTVPDICHGQPTIRGLRYPVESLLELLASGMTIEQIVADHPDLEREDLLAALEFAALAAGGHRVVPLSAA
jgi:uncharacterized protein (DUF433 family)